MRPTIGRLAVSSLCACFSNLAFAQDTINVPAATYYRNEGWSGNMIFTSAATSNYIMGREVTWHSLPYVLTTIPLTAPGLRIRNSAFPNRFMDFPAFTYNSASGHGRRVSGSLVGSPITAGSSFTIECVNLNGTGSDSSYSLPAQSFSTTIGNANLDYPESVFVDVIEGTALSNGELIVGPSATQPFVLGERAMILGGLLDASYLVMLSQPKLTIRHTAYPNESAVLLLAQNDKGIVEIGGDSHGIQEVSGSLVGKLIPTTGHFIYSYYPHFGPATDMALTDVKISLTEGSPVQTYATTGSFLCRGPLGHVDNGRGSLGFVPETFTGGSRLWVGGTMSEVLTTGSPSGADFRITNSAFPSLAITKNTSHGGYPSTAPFEVKFEKNYGPVLGTNAPTYGIVFPQGSEFTFEAYSSLTGSNGANAWTELRMQITSDFEAGKLYSAPVDLGVVSSNAPVLKTLHGSTGRWFKISLPFGINASSGQWLDIWTVGTPNTNTEISLYRANGNVIAEDDDDGYGFYSALSFGTGSGVQPLGGVISNGRDGAVLQPGDYYIAVERWQATFAAPFLANSGSSSVNHDFQLGVSTNAQVDQVLTSSITGAGTLFGGGLSKDIEYKVIQNSVEHQIGLNRLYWTSTGATFRAPIGLTGTAELVLDGGTFLRRRVPINLTGANQTLPTTTLSPGDIDNSGEIDAADIDAAIVAFGSVGDIQADVDISTEVDAADIDLIIANFGGTDE